MSQGGYRLPLPQSPGGLALVILLHAGVLGAVLLAKSEIIVKSRGEPIVVTLIKESKDPPPVAKPQPKGALTRPAQETLIDIIPIVPTLPTGPTVVLKAEPFLLPAAGGEVQPVEPPRVMPAPVRVEARMDSASEIQPPYPLSEQRVGREGSVVVRLSIGADGRVRQAEKVRATTDDFYRATERQALRHWRFRPATVDGRPVESSKLVTVSFRLAA